MAANAWMLAAALAATMPVTSAAQDADTPARVAARFLTAASQGDEAALDGLMGAADWRVSHPLLVQVLRERPQLLASYLDGGVPAVQEVVEVSPEALGVEALARVMLRSSAADGARPLYLVWSGEAWRVGSATGLIAGVAFRDEEADGAASHREPATALHTLLEGLFLVALGERHAGAAIVASVLAGTVTESAVQMILGQAETSPRILCSYAVGTTLAEGYEDLDPFGFRVAIDRVEERVDGGLRAFAVSTGARQPRAFGLVSQEDGGLLIADFASLLVGIEKPSDDTW